MASVARVTSTLVAALLAILGLGVATQAVAMPASITATTYAYDAPNRLFVPAVGAGDTPGLW